MGTGGRGCRGVDFRLQRIFVRVLFFCKASKLLRQLGGRAACSASLRFYVLFSQRCAAITATKKRSSVTLPCDYEIVKELACFRAILFYGVGQAGRVIATSGKLVSG